MKVCIYGLGALGKRHLEGVVKAGAESKKISSVALLDPMVGQEAVRGLLNTFDQKRGLLTLNDQASEFTIDATNVEGRVGALKSNANVLILEKPLFYTGASLRNFELALSARESRQKITYVNHARRCWPVYQCLVEALKASGVRVLGVQVKLSNAGLLSNYGHFLDLAAWFSNGAAHTIGEVRLDRVFDAKRAGFREAYGIFSGRVSGLEYEISDFGKGPSEVAVSVVISTEWGSIEIDEVKGDISMNQKLSKVIPAAEHDIRYCYQSNLTKHLVLDYVNAGKIPLPNAVKVMECNKPLVKTMEDKYGDVRFT